MKAGRGGLSRCLFRHRTPAEPAPLEELAVLALVDVAPGSAGVVHRLRGRRLLAIRLSALGFSVGARVTVIRNDRHGPLVVAVRGTRVALGRGAASKILVEAVGSAEPRG